MINNDNFSDILKGSANEIAESREESIDWFKDSIQQIINKVNNNSKINTNKIFEKDSRPSIGEMYLYAYDAKYKNILPFFDMFPLTIPVEMYTNGFLGVNLHYLPPMARAALLSQLKKYATNNKYNNNTKMLLSYELLKKYADQFSGVESCVKKYLFGQVRSSFHKVHPMDWDKVVMMPIQRWVVNPNKKYAGSPPY